MLMVVVDLDVVILTEPLLCLLSDEDVLSVLTPNFCLVRTVCHSGFDSLSLFFLLQM